jgi:hypothetical protein
VSQSAAKQAGITEITPKLTSNILFEAIFITILPIW